MCTVGGRIGWIVTRSGMARRPGIPGTITLLDKEVCDDSLIVDYIHVVLVLSVDENGTWT